DIARQGPLPMIQRGADDLDRAGLPERLQLLEDARFADLEPVVQLPLLERPVGGEARQDQARQAVGPDPVAPGRLVAGPVAAPAWAARSRSGRLGWRGC